MHRFFLIDSPIHATQPVDLTPLAYQLNKVLRLSTGTEIVVLDNQGNEYGVRISVLQAKYARGEVLTARRNNAEPANSLTLYQCSLKADKFEWVLQKGTELGVTTFVPVISQRSIVRPAAALLKKYERWQTIVREAAEQCGRGRIPRLLEPLDWEAAVSQAEGVRLLPWEEEQTVAPLLSSAALQSLIQAAPAVSLLIGPEGGIAPEEASAAQSAGWQTVSLGPRILRAETAALASVVMVTSAAG
ncbi:MAG: 16S rRNA (uracil(1498)-N(3))-methyltransferase [Caldilineaceae bacterium]|nr:16S rRNA (uracil(1498)-N(3))-methyltransferase [Caldilineaceae bacterium]